MPRRFIAATAGLGLPLLAAALLASAACGDGGQPPSPTPPPSPPPATTPAIPSTASPEVATPLPANFLDMASNAPILTIVSGQGDDLRSGGVSLARGDFNKDGVDDLLLGAPFADGPDDSREDAGEAYVILGSADLGASIDLGADEADLIIYGALPGDNLGFSVIATDLNGDGSDDVVVGAPGSNGLRNIRTDLGEAYVIFGSPSLSGTVDTANIEQDVTLRGAEGFARVGTSFAAGDVNGDGINDLIAGAPFAGRREGSPPGSTRTTEGEVYVVFGAPDLPEEIDVTVGQQDLRLKGAQELDGFGQAVASGDVNGDGIDDIIVAAPTADGPDDSRREAGEAYLFFGSAGLSGKLDSDEADVTIYGAEESDALGSLVTSGDLNGDGLTDIVLSAPFANGPDGLRTASGEAYVLLGSPTLGGTIDLAQQAPSSLIYGRDASDMMPSSLAVADLDGDGRDDLVLGAASAAGPANLRPHGGEAYVLLGDTLEGQIDLQLSTDERIFIFGSTAAEGLGQDALGLDMNDDGRRELLLLAVSAEAAPAEPGKLYLVELPGR